MSVQEIMELVNRWLPLALSGYGLKFKRDNPSEKETVITIETNKGIFQISGKILKEY